MFKSTVSKLQRAKHHIDDLERRFQAFVQENPHRFGIEEDPTTGKAMIQMRIIKELPHTIPAIIGDAIHNQRTALDHLTWEVIGMGGKQHDKLYFPLGKTREAFLGACKGLPTPYDWVKDTFKLFEAFPGGKGHVFYNLNILEITDKHRIIVPSLLALSPPAFTVYNAAGVAVVTMAGEVRIGGNNRWDLWPLAPGQRLEFDPNRTPPPSIFFPNVLNKDIFQILKETQYSISQVVEGMSSAVRKHLTS